MSNKLLMSLFFIPHFSLPRLLISALDNAILVTLIYHLTYCYN